MTLGIDFNYPYIDRYYVRVHIGILEKKSVMTSSRDVIKTRDFCSKSLIFGQNMPLTGIYANVNL